MISLRPSNRNRSGPANGSAQSRVRTNPMCIHTVGHSQPHHRPRRRLQTTHGKTSRQHAKPERASAASPRDTVSTAISLVRRICHVGGPLPALRDPPIIKEYFYSFFRMTPYSCRGPPRPFAHPVQTPFGASRAPPCRTLADSGHRDTPLTPPQGPREQCPP